MAWSRNLTYKEREARVRIAKYNINVHRLPYRHAILTLPVVRIPI